MKTMYVCHCGLTLTIENVTYIGITEGFHADFDTWNCPCGSSFLTLQGEFTPRTPARPPMNQEDAEALLAAAKAGDRK